MNITQGINIVLAVFWFIIAITYVYLLFKHWKWSKCNIEHPLKIKGAAAINGQSTGLVENREGINGFIDYFNQHNHLLNIAQMKGYIAASIAPLIGLALSITGVFVGGA